MYDAKLEISKLLAPHVTGLETQEIYNMLEVPPNPEMGDIAMPCFRPSGIKEVSGSNCRGIGSCCSGK